jgi:hypothetical protein
MFAESRVDDAAVEVDFGRVGDDLEVGEGVVELVVVVVTEGLDPGLDFLESQRGKAMRNARTCFSDMAARDQRSGSGGEKAAQPLGTSQRLGARTRLPEPDPNEMEEDCSFGKRALRGRAAL